MRNQARTFKCCLSRKLAGAILLVLVVGVILGSAGCAGEASVATPAIAPADAPVAKEFPDFVYNSATSLAAFQLAPQLVDVLSRIPCYCNCGRASGHKSLKDCFYKEDGSFNDHASNCDVCQDEIQDIAKWQKEGKSLREIRTAIDEKYREYGKPTDTAPIE